MASVSRNFRRATAILADRAAPPLLWDEQFSWIASASRRRLMAEANEIHPSRAEVPEVLDILIHIPAFIMPALQLNLDLIDLLVYLLAQEIN